MVFWEACRNAYEHVNLRDLNSLSNVKNNIFHEYVIKWKHFPSYWPFVRGIHRSPVNSPHKGQWHGALMLTLICVWINDWVNNREAGDLKRYRSHYDVIVIWCMDWIFCVEFQSYPLKIPNKISSPLIERCIVYRKVKMEELQDSSYEVLTVFETPPVPLSQPWEIWIDNSLDSAMINQNKRKHNNTSCLLGNILQYDDVIKWKHFPRNWPSVRGIHRSPVNSPHKGQWSGALMFSLICVWINDYVNNREASDLRRYRAHYDVIVMVRSCSFIWCLY